MLVRTASTLIHAQKAVSLAPVKYGRQAGLFNFFHIPYPKKRQRGMVAPLSPGFILHSDHPLVKW